MSESISENNSHKGRGRPKGSKNTSTYTRPDRTSQTKPGENARFLSHDLKLMRLPAIDINDEMRVQQRIEEYFSICTEDDIKPSIASLALALGTSRFTLFDWINGRNRNITNSQSILTLKKAYDAINSYYEHMMNNGKINPVAGIFLMKNNLGYKDQTDYVVSTGSNEQLRIEDIADRAGLLNE